MNAAPTSASLSRLSRFQIPSQYPRAAMPPLWVPSSPKSDAVSSSLTERPPSPARMGVCDDGSFRSTGEWGLFVRFVIRQRGRIAASLIGRTGSSGVSRDRGRRGGSGFPARGQRGMIADERGTQLSTTHRAELPVPTLTRPRKKVWAFTPAVFLGISTTSISALSLKDSSTLKGATASSAIGYGTTGLLPVIHSSRVRPPRRFGPTSVQASSRFFRATAVWMNRTAICFASLGDRGGHLLGRQVCREGGQGLGRRVLVRPEGEEGDDRDERPHRQPRRSPGCADVWG